MYTVGLETDPQTDTLITILRCRGEVIIYEKMLETTV